MKKKKDNNTRNIAIAIVAVAMIIGLVGGGTYAYWTWITNTSQRTSYNLIVASPTFKITGTNVTGKVLAPTASCYNSNYTLAGRATVEATNNTSVKMRASLTLQARITASTGSLSSANLTHLHWAIKEVATNTTAFAAANCAGTNGTGFTTGTFTTAATTANTDYTTTVTFDVNAGANATKYYQLYVWIDSTYNHQNTGSEQTDPMQNMTVLLTFSKDNSKFSQVES